MGVSSDGKPHRFCVGNEQGEILPKFLMGERTAPISNLPLVTCYLLYATCPRTPYGYLFHIRPTAKFIVIESGKVFGRALTTTITDDERDRLYAMAREAQHRDIKPLAVKPEKGVKTKRAPAEPKQPKTKAAKKQATPPPEPEPELEPEPEPEPEPEAEPEPESETEAMD